ncbi:MAG: hypothetical protein D4R83_00705 [Streptomycetaceae bacterium]|nr:MAG: hypothetical protein D4R83_00705 [Streptomycetaceae bacterium]
MERKVSCHLSADALSEIRRKVYNSRKNTFSSKQEVSDNEIVSHDMRLIEEFITEEFEDEYVALFNSRVQPDPWPEINSWEYPGPWLNPISENLSRILDEKDAVYIFSKSGSYHLHISKIV